MFVRYTSYPFTTMQIRDLEGWGITNLIRPYQEEESNSITVDVDKNNLVDASEPLYWIAPVPYLQNKVPSYGGKLIYTVTFTLPRDGQSSGYVKPDVRIEVRR